MAVLTVRRNTSHSLTVCLLSNFENLTIFGEMCVLTLIYSHVAVCSSEQYVVELSFASICCLLITRLMFLNILFKFVFLFCVFVFYFVYSVFLYFLCIFPSLHIAVSFLILYKFTEHCYRMETHLQ